MPFILPANSLSAGGYTVDNSLRFNSASSDYLSKVPTTGTNRKIQTFSTWVKKCQNPDGDNTLFLSYYSIDERIKILFDSSQRLSIGNRSGGSNTIILVTNRLFRDVSAWYHIVVAMDTTQATASNRVKIYVNGVQETSFVTAIYPSLNEDLRLGTSSYTYYLGSYGGSSGYLDGYMSDVYGIDGQALAPTDFGEFDEDSGIWKPIDVSGLTFGTNGFYLDFEDSGALGADTSGNGNDFTVNNLTAVDQTTDTPTNNFATMNPLDNYYASALFAEGNIKLTTDASAEAMSTATFAVSAGRWYFEVDCISIGASGTANLGVTATPSHQNSSYGKSGGVTPFTHTWNKSGTLQSGNGSGGSITLATLSSYAAGDILGVYLDLEDMKTYWSKNGTLENSGTGIALTALASNGTGHYIPFVGDYNTGGAAVFEVNFGNGFQALADTAIADDNGYGAFEYSPNITGDGAAKKFYALCTKNLNEFNYD